MEFKQTIKIFGVLFGVLLLGILIGVTLADIGYVPVGSPPAGGLASVGAASQQEIAVELTIDYGNGDQQVFPRQTLQGGHSVLDLLQQSGVTLEKRNFPGLGMFIEAINGVHNSNNYYWQFWVNGKYATIAAEAYELRNNDKVLWKRTNELPKQ